MNQIVRHETDGEIAILTVNNPPEPQNTATVMTVALSLRNQDGDEVWVIYHDPKDLAELHGISLDTPAIATMTGALSKLTGAATQSE